LISALQDADNHVRRAAARALRKIGNPDAMEPLVARLDDQDKWVRCAAIRALGGLAPQRAVAPLVALLSDPDPDICTTAVDALAHVGDPAVDMLIAALDMDKSQSARHIAEALGRIGHARGVIPLLELLQVKDVIVAEKAAKALGTIGDVRAVEPLLAALAGNMERLPQIAAIHALGKLGDVRAVEPLKAMRDSSDMRVYKAATQALNELGVSPTIARPGNRKRS
jgi:HEAT repeat protein